MEISGYCEDRFDDVRKEYTKIIDEGLEVGSSFSVTIEGKTVIDLWSGYSDEAKTKLWDKDTIVNVYSTSKFVTSVCMLMLMDRGIIDAEAPVANYWPEFAQAGKEKITIAHLLSHTAGLPGFNETLDIKDFYNWDKATELLSKQEPWWEDRGRSGYHAVTRGFLLGEVMKRVTNKSVGDFLKEEITDPLNIDFRIGKSDTERERIAELIPPKMNFFSKIMFRFLGFMMRNTFFNEVFMNPVMEVEDVMSKEWQAAELPSANGHGNARSIAKIAAIIANGGELDGKRLLSKEIIEKALDSRTHGRDLVINMPIKFGLGFATNDKGGIVDKFCPNPRTLYWGGYGGSLIIADLDEKMSFGYAMNKQGMKMIGDPRGERLIKKVYACLQKD